MNPVLHKKNTGLESKYLAAPTGMQSYCKQAMIKNLRIWALSCESHCNIINKRPVMYVHDKELAMVLTSTFAEKTRRLNCAIDSTIQANQRII